MSILKPVITGKHSGKPKNITTYW